MNNINVNIHSVISSVFQNLLFLLFINEAAQVEIVIIETIIVPMVIYRIMFILANMSSLIWNGDS